MFSVKFLGGTIIDTWNNMYCIVLDWGYLSPEQFGIIANRKVLLATSPQKHLPFCSFSPSSLALFCLNARTVILIDVQK